MDESTSGAVNRARGELEKRRQEAYRARAAATVKIQRWYRRRRAGNTRTSTNGGARSLKSEIDLSTEESCAESTSATLSTISQQESQGANHTVSDDAFRSDSDDNPVHSRNARSSSSQLQERSNSFDEFVNSEVAVARAMVDDRYIENLNDAQKKRVERLKAYQKCSDNPIAIGVPETLQTEHSPSSNSSSVSQVDSAVESIPGPKPNASEEVAQSAGKAKSLIPVWNNKMPLSDLHKSGIKTEKVRKAEVQKKPQTTINFKLGHAKQDVIAQVPNRSIAKQKVTKPTSNQKEQWRMKEQHIVQNQQQAKGSRQIEQPGALEELNQANDDTKLPHATKDSAKIGDKSEMARVNDTNMQEGAVQVDSISSEDTVQTDTTPSSSSTEGGAHTSLQTKDTQMRVYTRAQGEENKQSRQARSNMQQTRQKVLKFASNVMCQNSNSTVHDPTISEAKPHGIVKQPPHPPTAAIGQGQQDEEIPLLKKSSATTRLTLESEKEREDSAPLLKRRHKITEEIHSDSTSFLNQGQSLHGSKLTKCRPTEARRQRVINAATAYTDDSDSDDSSPEHLPYAGIQPQAMRASHPGSKSTSQGGGYGAVYAKRRETNRKRIIRSLRTPQCKPMEKKQPGGYLQKFLHSSEVQNYLEDLSTNSAPPSYSSSKGTWHTAWTSMGGLPRPGLSGLHTPPGHSPPPQEWMSVMSHASCISLLFEGSHDSPLHHQVVPHRRRPHHLHPLVAPKGNKQFTTSKAGHFKSYTYHYNQQLRQQAVRPPAQYSNNSQQLSLSSRHRQSLSHVIPRSWRRELYYEPDMKYNRCRGPF